jgi:crotonobetaine/carnitine-CoA ligase
MMKEYFQNPEATRSAFLDGWFATGDLVERDEQGRLYHRGRSKDMIRRSGENIAAVEVEDTLSSYDEVGSVAVVGVPDELRGEEVFALIVPRDPAVLADVSRHESLISTLRARCQGDLAGFKVPRYWVMVESLPRSASERLLKNELDVVGLLAGAADTSIPHATAQ